jgi:hypothetical protein
MLVLLNWNRAATLLLLLLLLAGRVHAIMGTLMRTW